MPDDNLSPKRRRNKKEPPIPSEREELPLLKTLAALYEVHRPKIKPVYPYDREANTIHLPPPVVKELKKLIRTGEKPAAVKRVAELTGAGLRLAKDYVDALEK